MEAVVRPTGIEVIKSAILSLLIPLDGSPTTGACTAFRQGSRSRRFERNKMFLPHPRVKVSIVGSLRDREVAC